MALSSSDGQALRARLNPQPAVTARRAARATASSPPLGQRCQPAADLCRPRGQRAIDPFGERHRQEVWRNGGHRHQQRQHERHRRHPHVPGERLPLLLDRRPLPGHAPHDVGRQVGRRRHARVPPQRLLDDAQALRCGAASGTHLEVLLHGLGLERRVLPPCPPPDRPHNRSTWAVPDHTASRCSFCPVRSMPARACRARLNCALIVPSGMANTSAISS